MIIEVDKKKVFASDAGLTFDRNKETVILLHGSGQSHVVWSLTEQYISSLGFNVLTIDLPGHGNSEGESLKSIEEIAVWLDKLLNKIGTNQVTIVGHSQGCLIGIDFASKYPKLINKLVLVAGSYMLPVNQVLFAILQFFFLFNIKVVKIFIIRRQSSSV